MSFNMCQAAPVLNTPHALRFLPAGMGEQELDTEQDFSRVGRVNAMLARRLQLLAQVDKMARQFGVVSNKIRTLHVVFGICSVVQG